MNVPLFVILPNILSLDVALFNVKVALGCMVILLACCASLTIGMFAAPVGIVTLVDEVGIEGQLQLAVLFHAVLVAPVHVPGVPTVIATAADESTQMPLTKRLYQVV
jgi:hypothetical protein